TNQTINHTAGNIYELAVSKTTGELILATDVTASNFIIDSNAYFSLNLATFNLTSAFNQSDGTFLTPSGTGEITFTGFTQSGGIFNAPSGNLYITGTFNRTAGDFNHNNGTVTFLANNNYNITTAGVTFYNLVFNKTAGGSSNALWLYDNFTAANDLIVKNEHPSNYYYNVYGSSSPTITVLGNLTFPLTTQTAAVYFGYPSSYNFTINLASNFILNDADAYMRANLTLNGVGDQTLTQNIGYIEYGTWTVNKTTGLTSVLTGLNLTQGSDFNLILGTFNCASFNLTADAFSQAAGIFNGGSSNITFNSLTQSAGTFNASLSLTANNSFTQSGGTFNAPSNLTVGGSGFTQSGGTFNGAAGTITFNGFVQTAGIFNASSGNLYISNTFNRTVGTFNHNNGTVTFLANSSYNITTAGVTFYNLIFNKTAGSGYYNLMLYDDFTVANDLTIKNEYPTYYYYVYGPGLSAITVSGNLIFPSTPSHTGQARFGDETPTHSFTVNLAGNFTMNDNEAYCYAKVNFSGITNQTINHTAGNIYELAVSKTTGELILATDLTANAFSQSAGTFNGSTSTITFNRFTQSGGIFNAPSGNLYITGTFNRTGGTFNHNNGTVTFLGSYNITTAGVTFYNLVFNKTDGSSGSILWLYDDFTVANDLIVKNEHPSNYYYNVY
ncbi:MAG: hypothetical protein KKE55_07290, partial [Candidatus Omnitrophica bacterium]|nr:hypothetical protein [Candidatus Omnitrophota bacterium]